MNQNQVDKSRESLDSASSGARVGLAKPPTPQHTPSLFHDHSPNFFDKFKNALQPPSSAFRPFYAVPSSPSSTPRKNEGLRKHRGNYRKYSVAEKEEAVRQILDGVDAKEISERYGIPRRNLLRWKKNGCERKEGGGRPTDAEMEFTLYTKIQDRTITSEKEIRAEAKRLSKLQDFKASKGWYCKFSRRYNQWKRHRQLENGEEEREELLPEPSLDSDDDNSMDSLSAPPSLQARSQQ